MSSKKLSEQVALLEDARDHYRAGRDELIDDNSTLQADLSALDQDRHRLLAERAGLEAERDRLKADAMSDLTQRHWLETQVRNREAERDDLQRQVQEARDEHHKFTATLGFGDGVTEPSATYEEMLEPLREAMQESLDHHECPMICELCGERLADTPCEHCHGSGADIAASQAAMAYSECEWCAGVGRIHPGCVEKSYADLVAEVDDLRAKLDRATDDMETHLEADSIVDAENEAVAATTVPRLITADELREGQTVAIWCIESGTTDLMAMLGVVERTNGRDVTLRSDCTGAPNWHNVAAYGINIVLLEDAPHPTGYADDDHQDAEVTQRHEPEPETVAAEDGIKGIFTTLLKAKRTEDERAQKIWDAWQTALAEVYLGPDDAETTESVAHHRDDDLPWVTVDDMDAAPVGTVLGPRAESRFAQKFTKGPRGMWRGDLNGKDYQAAYLADDGTLPGANLIEPEGGTKHE